MNNESAVHRDAVNRLALFTCRVLRRREVVHGKEKVQTKNLCLCLHF